jgi:phosphoribosylformylglycinamidine (FGAM) synthase-like amidotransferase family enzyme
MTTEPARWSYLVEPPGADPDRDCLVLESGGQCSMVVAVAAGLVRDERVTLVELCGGFGSGDVAAVGHVVFGADQIPAAAYATAAGSVTGRPR